MTTSRESSVWDAHESVRFKFGLILKRVPRTVDGCALWPLKKNKAGYGEFHWIDPITKIRSGSGAHKVSLELKLGRKLKEGHLAAHVCPKRHHRNCFAPEHLVEATQVENMTVYANPGETDYAYRLRMRKELLDDVYDITQFPDRGEGESEF